MLQGQQPNLSHNQQPQPPVAQNTPQAAMNNQHDKILCSDLLSTEKYVSGTYDIDIFESAEPEFKPLYQRRGQETWRCIKADVRRIYH